MDKKERGKLFCRLVLSSAALILVILFWSLGVIESVPEQLLSIVALAALIIAVIAVIAIFRSLSTLVGGKSGTEQGEVPQPDFWKQETEKLPPATVLKLVSVRSLLEDWDIIEFLVLTKSGIVKLGATAETLAGGSEFFNKKFYIEDKVYDSANMMSAALEELFPEEEVEVYLIDGVEAKYWKIPG